MTTTSELREIVSRQKSILADLETEVAALESADVEAENKRLRSSLEKEKADGDKARAEKVYEGVTPLTGDDIAEAIAWVAQLPDHMNVNDMVLMPAQQAGAYYTVRRH